MLIACAVAFLMLSRWSDKEICYSLSLLAASLWINTQVFDVNDMALYLTRAILTMFVGFYLAHKAEPAALYQAVILLSTIIVYTLNEVDLAFNTNIIYDNYKAIIYGLITCHFVGIFRTLRPDISNGGPDHRLGCKNL